ncbi:MAG TPA: exonuclease SbcCD subunit D [Egibacteraceae bacterium]|nr:exonuclease SbcCD subunit D [Egibacteraceae bacterium]
MRLLHVSDWHLGVALGRVSRLPDHVRVLDELTEVARQWRPHLVVHSGDLFHATRPPVEAMQLAAESLGRLSAIAPTVVVAGNHDSRALLRVLDTFQKLRPGTRRLWFVTEPQVLCFAGDGGEDVRLACMPFLHPNTLVDLLANDPAAWTGAYADGVRVLNRQLQAQLEAGYQPPRDVLLYAAHLHVHDAKLGGTERSVHVSEDYATRVESLPPVTYAAFGHIHRPQALPGGSVSGRYAGSPIAIDFGEHGEDKSVVCVQATPGGSARTEVVGLSGGRRLVRFEGSWGDFCAQAGGVGDGILKAVIETDVPDPELADKVAERCPDASVFEIANRVTSSLDRPLREAGDAEAEADVVDLFREYAAAQNLRHATPDRVLALFDAAMAGVHAEQPADFGLADLLGDPTQEPG